MLFFKFAMKIAHAYIKKKRMANVVQPRYMLPKKVFHQSLISNQHKKALLASTAFRRKDSIPRNPQPERTK